MAVAVMTNLNFVFQSDDKTVFFLTVGETYDPIGFITVPSEVTHLTWSPSSHVSTYVKSPTIRTEET